MSPYLKTIKVFCFKWLDLLYMLWERRNVIMEICMNLHWEDLWHMLAMETPSWQNSRNGQANVIMVGYKCQMGYKCQFISPSETYGVALEKMCRLGQFNIPFFVNWQSQRRTFDNIHSQYTEKSMSLHVHVSEKNMFKHETAINVSDILFSKNMTFKEHIWINFLI